MSMLKEFRDFAMRGSVIDLAVGVVIGAAFSKIVNSFVSNLIMPPINLLTARFGINFSQAAIKINTESPVLKPDGTMEKDAAGEIVTKLQDYSVLNYGPFIETIVEFVLIAVALFIAIKAANHFREKKAPEPEAATAEDILLLREIRDSLRSTR